MDEEQWDKVYELKDKLWKSVHDLVDAELEGVPEDISEEVRQQMTEDFRFWKR